MKIAYTYPGFVLVALIDLLMAGLLVYEGNLVGAAAHLIGGATLLVVIWGLRMSERNLQTSKRLLIEAQAEHALAAAARRPMVMPEITLDADGRIGKVTFAVGEIPSQGSAYLAIPIIHGLPPMELDLYSTRPSGRFKTRFRMDWESGQIDMLSSEDPDLHFESGRGGSSV